MKISGAVPVQSSFGLIELDKSGKWNPSLSSTTVDIVCERAINLNEQEEQKSEGRLNHLWIGITASESQKLMLKLESFDGLGGVIMVKKFD